MKMIRTGLAVLIAGLALQGAALAQPAAAPVVTTAYGQVSGVRDDGADAYLGIPFAQPPVGAMRWKAPARPAAWTGVRDGSKFGANCYQAPPARFGPYTPEFLIELPVSEDCLYLNVWTPAKRGGRLPVIVWIHGGGYGSGSGSIPIYDGADLAEEGVVVVSVNYRLGAFGFMAHPALSAESSRGTSGNYGLMDMIAALHWVRDNAAAFGGDPGRVTIMGQSAGAAAVNALQLAPDAKGLFTAAIAESGSGGLGLREQTLADAEAQGVAFAQKLGAASAEALRAVAPDAIVEAARGALPGSGGPPGPRFAPNVDGKVLVASTEDPAARPVSNVPLISGFNIDEIGLAGLDQRTSAAEFETSVRDRFGAMADGVLAAYPHATDAEASRSALQLTRDRLFANLILWEGARAEAGQTVFGYMFDHVYPGPEAAKWGAFHTVEVPYVFGVLDLPGRTFTEADRAVSDQVQAYWVNFARRGDPNPPGRTVWPAVQSGDYRLMRLGDHPGAQPAVSTPERFALLQEAWAAGLTR